DRRRHARRRHRAAAVGPAPARADLRHHRSRRDGASAGDLLGRDPGVHRHRRERRFRRIADRPAARRPRPRRPRRRRRPGQHQPRSDARRRQLSEAQTSLMPAVSYPRVVAAAAAFIAAYVVVRVANALVQRGLKTLDIVGAENRDAVHARAKQMLRALTALAYTVAALAAISLVLERFGINEPNWNPRLFLHWGLVHGVNVGIILVGALVVTRAANLAIEHLQFKLARRHA